MGKVMMIVGTALAFGAAVLGLDVSEAFADKLSDFKEAWNNCKSWKP